MKTKKKLKYAGWILLLFVVVVAFSYDKILSTVSRSFGITIAVITGEVDSITVNVLKNIVNKVIIKPSTGEIEALIPIGSFSQDLSFTLNVKANLPAADRGTVKLSPIGTAMTASPALQPGKDLTVSIAFRDQDITGLDRSKLAIARYDQASGKWLVLRSIIYTGENKVTALTGSIGIFALVQLAPALDLSGIRVYPNPWYPARVPQGVVIDGLTNTAEIRIYAITGELVTSLSVAGGNGRITWNGTNSAGGNAASGIYIAVIRNGSEMKKVKIALERR